MDIKSVVNDIVKKLKGDKNLLANFKKDPAKTVKSLAGDVAEDQIQDIVKEVTAKIGTEKAVSKLKGLFGK